MIRFLARRSLDQNGHGPSLLTPARRVPSDVVWLWVFLCCAYFLVGCLVGAGVVYLVLR